MNRSLTLALAAVVIALALPLAAQETHGINTSDMDPSAKPCQDFFHYGDGGWIKANPIPPEHPRWGSFIVLADQNRERQHAVLEALSKSTDLAAGSEEKKLADYWCACMDEKAVEAAGAKPIEVELKRIAAIGSVAEVEAEVARLQTQGVRVPFAFSSEQDRKNSAEMIGTVRQSGLGLPDRDYYVNDDARSKEIRGKYATHVAALLRLVGDDAAQGKAEAETVIALETELAKVSMTRVERRDPDKTYHRMSQADLATLAPEFDWPAYFSAVQAPPIASLNVAQPDFVRGMGALLKRVPLDQWKTYLRWHLVNAAAPHLSSAFVSEDFEFRGRALQGTQKLEERWKRCASDADRQMGFVLGRLWAEKYFPPEAKKQADQLVHNLIGALRADIATLD